MPKKKTTKKKPAKRKPAKKKVSRTKKPKKATIKKVSSKSSYSAKDITVLKGLEPVRKRPGMYIGGTGVEGLHHLIWEVVDNSIDEAMAGYCTEIEVVMEKNNRVKISDNGRGIPVEKHKATRKSALETVLTTLHAGGKFGGSGYKVSGGLHGVGVSVVNALSVWLKAEVRRDNKVYVQEYKRGKAQGKLKTDGKSDHTGTIISFEPDPEIFDTIEFSWKSILTHLRQQSYLTKGVKITIIDERGEEPNSYSFYFEGGIKSYVNHLNRKAKVVHQTPFYVEKEQDKIMVETALQYREDVKSNEVSFANNIHTVDGGMHLVGFRTALTRVLNDYARKNGLIKDKDENLTGEDMREGLTAVVSVKLQNPQFEGQTKAKLGNPEARTAVNGIIGEEFANFLEEHPAEARAMIGKVLIAAKARMAAKAAKDVVLRKGALDGFALPGKLADCSTKDSSRAELFIVEGDSAGGSAKQGRDRMFQAILPLRGKILNVERARIDRMLSNKEIKSIIIALGTGVGEEVDLNKLRYNRIVIMTDADVDGAHIRTLLLTLFYRYFPELIEAGHLYIAQPPLFRIQKGAKFEYVYSENQKDDVVAKFEKDASTSLAQDAKKTIEEEQTEENEEGEKTEEGEEEIKKKSGVSIQRYKGLGEMNPTQLWDTTMDPETRSMLQVKVDDAEAATENFEILMGDEVEPRKRFIQTHAKKVKNLDV
ncbi:MAG: DNA topoisomerase (ATP-hydrolyzing) subunit B [bacterium]